MKTRIDMTKRFFGSAWAGVAALLVLPLLLTTLPAAPNVVAWGSNQDGQTNVPPSLTNVVAVARSFVHSLALRADGTVVAWGPDYNGDVNVPPGLSNVVAIAAASGGWGPAMSLALRTDGTVVGWGLHQDDVPVGLACVTALSSGWGHWLALIGDGPPLLQASLMHPTRTLNGFSVSAPTQRGHVYALEYKNALSDLAWTTQFPLLAGTGEIRTLTDSTATPAQRFYRVRRW